MYSVEYYADVELPLSDDEIAPGRVHSFHWSQKRYEHDFGKVVFKDWNVDPTSLLKGTPVKIKVRYEGIAKSFFAYIHHVTHKRETNKSYTEVHLIGASYVMKQATQDVYMNLTASDIVTKIAKKYQMAYDIAPHSRVFPQVAHAGHTDWELCVRLAKQCGYTFRVDGTTLYFKPISEDFTALKSYARNFFLTPPANGVPPTLYSITPLVGETLEFEDGYKAASAVSGVDPKTGKAFAATQLSLEAGTRKNQNPNLFDRFDVHTSAHTLEAAKFEVKAVDERNKFPYRATAVLRGTANLRPDMPMYFSQVNADLDGYWCALEVEHIIENGIFTTEVVAGLDTVGSDAAAPNGYLGAKMTPPNASLSIISKNIKPKADIVLSKVVNRLSATPASVVSAKWVGSGTSIRGKTSSANKAAAVLGA